MSRNAPTLLVLALLLATATAFAVTQRLKLEPSPISQTRVADAFSPVCECASETASIEFSLREPGRLRISIRLAAGEVTIADGSFRAGLVRAEWNGRDASGSVVPDGIYYPVVRLQRDDRTIELPNPIRVDTSRPSIRLTSLRPERFTPLVEKLTVTYTVSERAHALLFVDGRRVVLTATDRVRGALQWYGRTGGRPVKPGRHRLTLVAEDLAGNRSESTPAVFVRTRRAP